MAFLKTSNWSVFNSINLYFATQLLIGTLLALNFNNLSLLFLVVLLSVITVFVVPKDRKLIQIILLSSILFYIIMLLTYYGWVMKAGLPYTGGGSDDWKFEEHGRIYAENNWFDFRKNHGYSTNTRLYVTFIALLYKVTPIIDGYHTLLPRIFNGFFETWVVIIVYKLMKYDFNIPMKSTYIGLYVLILNPYFKYINSFVFRDTLALLIFMSIIYLSIKLIGSSKTKFINVVLFLSLLFLSYYVRGQLLIISLGSFLMIYLLKKNLKGSIIFAFLIIGVSLVLDYVFGFIGYFEQLNAYTDYQGDNDGMISKLVQLPLFPIGVILRYLYAFSLPWPNIFNLFTDVRAVYLDIIYLFCYTFVIWQFRNISSFIIGGKSQKLIGVLLLLTLSMYALTTLTYRHIIMVYPFLAISYAQYHSIKHKSKLSSLYKNISMIAFILLLVTYGIIK